MPNWVTNILSVSGETSLEKIASDIKIENAELGAIDFNKIIARPKELDLCAGSLTNEAVSAYYSSCAPYEKEEVEKIIRSYNSAHPPYMSINYLSKHRPDKHNNGELKKAGVRSWEEYGKLYVDNIKKYGCPDWYEWCCEAWGTKWNAHSGDYYCSEGKSEPSKIVFETAFSTPEPLIRALSAIYPDTYFTVVYADEDFGSNVGKYCYANGILYKARMPEEQSIEALNMAADVLGAWELDGYKFDEVKKTYVEVKE